MPRSQKKASTTADFDAVLGLQGVLKLHVLRRAVGAVNTYDKRHTLCAHDTHTNGRYSSIIRLVHTSQGRAIPNSADC